MKYNGIELSEFLYLATTRCNCRCKHCSPSVYTGKPNEMTSAQLISQYKRSKILKQVPVSVAGGEPFLKEDLDEFIIYLAGQHIPCVISTNGWYVEKIEKLLSKLGKCSTVRFAISIDGPEKMHDSIRRRDGIYRRALDSAVQIRDAGLEVQVNTVIQKENLAGLEDFDQFFKQNNLPVIYIPKVFVGEESFDFTAEDMKKMFRYVNYARGRKYLLSGGKYLIQNCHAGRSSWVIDCNGDIYTCWGGYYKDNSRDYIMGNLLENDFDEIFVSEKKEAVCRGTVAGCEGCLLPRDIERETEIFHFSTKLTYEETALLKEELSSKSTLQDYAITADEWYGPEKLENRTFRWMRGTCADIYVRCEGDGKGLLRIEYLNGKPEKAGEEPVTATVFANGINAGSFVCVPGKGCMETELSIEDDLLVQVRIQLNKTWRPNDYAETSDKRSLGLAIFKVEIV